ncbi:MAG: hypothetical protein JO141_22535 [Bradyrhizobium sp.]|nr:hypothetical protein [Bradyrhizobium sp.]
MSSLGKSTPPGLLSGFVRSYGRDLRGWASGILIRYAVAVILLLGAAAGLIAAIGVGADALFHWLETNYGLATAYEVIAGILAGLGIASAVIGVAMLKAAPPPLPRPHPHARAAASKATMALAMPARGLAKSDRTTEVMIGLAAACVAGWLVFSRMQAKTK